MKHIVSIIILVAGLSAIAPLAEAQQARNLAEFCGVWQGVCNRTCPAGTGNCQPVCAQRRATCMTTRCFPFNNPGPRCFTDASARQATDTKYAPNPQSEQQRRARQQAGSR
jgi:hypothetical protein